MSPLTEQQLLDRIINLAIRCRWAVHHDRPARRAGNRWETAIQGHAGFPDLVLARAGVVLFRELKGYDKNGRIGRLSSEQRDWAKQLNPAWPNHCANCEHPEPLPPSWRRDLTFDVWTPDDWDTVIVPTLTARTAA